MLADITSVVISVIGVVLVFIGTFVAWRNRKAIARYINSPQGGGLVQAVQANVASIIEENYKQMTIRLNDMQTALDECQKNHKDMVEKNQHQEEKISELESLAVLVQAAQSWFEINHQRFHQQKETTDA